MLATCLVLFSAALAAQSSGGSYVVSRHVVQNGGGRSSGADYAVNGTIGQVEPGPPPDGRMDGGAYALRGGFWPGAGGDQSSPGIFTDGFE